MNYDFLDEKFPIKFIDKIVTCLPLYSFDEKPVSQLYYEFFDKAHSNNVKILSLLVDKGFATTKFALDKYDIEKEIVTKYYKVLKLKIRS